MSRVTLRRARAADAALLTAWDSEPDVVAAHGNEESVYRDEDWLGEIEAAPPWREILMGEEDGRAFGVVIDIDPALEKTHYWGDCGPGLRALDIWIGVAADRSRGLGAEMMRLAIARAFEDKTVHGILIDPLAANKRAIRFYERCGFRPVERRQFDEDDCLVMRLDRPAPA